MNLTLGIVNQGQGDGVTSKCFSIHHNTNCLVIYLSFETGYDSVNNYVSSTDINKELLKTFQFCYYEALYPRSGSL